MRGRELSMIFQNPRTALNPIRTVGQQIADVLVRHGGATRRDAPRAAIEMLKKVRIPDPERRAEAYPFELSGGMCQRIMIAIALACRPALLIADEPTTGLDVTTQAVIMDLIGELARESRHGDDLHHPRSRARRRVLRPHRRHACRPRRRGGAGRARCSPHPRHPYSAKLLAATPGETASLAELASIPGGLPDLRRADLPACRYSGAASARIDDCAEPLPRRDASATRHVVACWNPL